MIFEKTSTRNKKNSFFHEFPGGSQSPRSFQEYDNPVWGFIRNFPPQDWGIYSDWVLSWALGTQAVICGLQTKWNQTKLPNINGFNIMHHYSKSMKQLRYLTMTVFLCSLVIWQKGESQNRGNKNTKQATFSEKRTFFTPWYTHVRVHIRV